MNFSGGGLGEEEVAVVVGVDDASEVKIAAPHFFQNAADKRGLILFHKFDTSQAR